MVQKTYEAAALAPVRLVKGVRLGTDGGRNYRANASPHFAKPMDSWPDYDSSQYRGRGIVTCAGGLEYFICVWVLIRGLRARGCCLPIECWYLGPNELDEEMTQLLSSYGVRCVDAYARMNAHPYRFHPAWKGWQLKPYAIAHSSFEEVLFLDADNCPTRDPTFLFESTAYLETGAIFWPDREPLEHSVAGLPAHTNMWDICKIPYRVEPSFETGQILIKKAKSWRPLGLTLHFNEHADYYYQLQWRDKDTFHFAWLVLDIPFTMIPFAPIDKNWHALYQHDLSGHVLFQHRNGDRWTYSGTAIKLPDFQFEDECNGFIMELRDYIIKSRHISLGR